MLANSLLWFLFFKGVWKAAERRSYSAWILHFSWTWVTSSLYNLNLRKLIPDLLDCLFDYMISLVCILTFSSILFIVVCSYEYSIVNLQRTVVFLSIHTYQFYNMSAYWKYLFPRFRLAMNQLSNHRINYHRNKFSLSLGWFIV